jgi:hypothetical protein
MNEEQHESVQPEIPESSPKKRKLTDFIGIGGLIGIVVGAIAGYLYYYYIGCRSGSCPINSNPWVSTLWGALIGYLGGDMFRQKKVRK